MILKTCFELSSLTKTINKFVHYSKQGTFNALPSTVFKVVKQTQKYNQFIPWCSRSHIVKHISQQQNFTQLTITFKNLKQLSYLSHVKIDGQNTSNPKFKIQSVCKDDPLKSLISIWQIQKDSIIKGQTQQSLVKYSIDYQFSSPLLQLTSHLFLNYVGESMWLIFKEQAEKRQKINRNDLNIHENNLCKVQDENIFKQQKNQSTVEKITSPTIFSQQKAQLLSTQTKIKQKQLQSDKHNSLSVYLAKNQKMQQIYTRNIEFKRKIDQWSKKLQGTKDFEQKLEFKIKNYFLYKA